MNPPFVSLLDIPFLNLKELGDRSVPLMPLWDGVSWTVWHPVDDGRGPLLETHPVDASFVTYWAKKEEREIDIFFPFSDFVWQHASWPSVARAAISIEGRLRNLCTAVAKIDLFWQHRGSSDSLDVGEFVATEMEYICVIARSVLDDLQKVIARIWERIKLLDIEAQRRKKDLPPERMAKIALHQDKPRSAADLMATYGLPAPIAEFYSATGSFLQKIKRLRDGVIHHGESNSPIFVVEKGFAVGRGQRLFETFSEIWREQHAYNENVYSLRPLIAHVAVNVLHTCTSAAQSLVKCLAFPPEVAPGYRAFIRASHTAALLKAQKVLHGDNPWWDQS